MPVLKPKVTHCSLQDLSSAGGTADGVCLVFLANPSHLGHSLIWI